MRNSKTTIAKEDDSDGLNVTEAILNAKNNSNILDPVDISRMADEIHNLEVAEDLNEDREEPNQSDMGDPVSTDNMIQDLDASDNETTAIDPTEQADQEFQASIEDVKAVESIMEKVLDNNLSTEDCKCLNSLSQKYMPQELDHYSVESFDVGYGVERIKALVAAIWRAIISAITKVIDVGRVAIDVYNSKLRLAHDDIYEIKKNAEKIRGKSTSQTVIDNAYNQTLILENFRTARDMITSAGFMDSIFKSYFEHVKINVPMYVDSLYALFDDDNAFKDGYVVEENENGTKSVNISGQVRINKDTVPGFMKVVNEIPGIMRSFPGSLMLKSKTMPGGLILAAWVARDFTVSTAGETDVLKSKMILTSDPGYNSDSNELPVMTFNELINYLTALEKLTTTLQQAEVHALNYNRSLISLRKKLVEMQRHATVLENDVQAQGYEYIVQYKRRLANTASRLVQTTENFYGTPTRSFMIWGNRYLAYSLRYANSVTAAYLLKDKSQ